MRPNIRTRQSLDRKLGRSDAHLGHVLNTPQPGWIKAVRSAIGMTATQLAQRLDVSHPAVLKFEKAELDGAITLRNMSRIAEAMDCELVYGFVPKGTFEEVVVDRAQAAQVEIDSRDLWVPLKGESRISQRSGRRNKLIAANRHVG